MSLSRIVVYKLINCRLKIIVESTLKFILNAIVPLEENQFIEFKEITALNPIKSIQNTVDEYVVAFLNSLKNREGSIYWGINNNRVVVGVKLNASQRDDLRKAINNQLDKVVPPIFSPKNYVINLYPICNEVMLELEDHWVIEVKVTQNIENSPVYFTNGKTCYIKTDSGRKEIYGAELVEYIRIKHQLIIESYQINNLIDFVKTSNNLAPILHWIDKPIPANQAKLYLGKLQYHFCSPKLLTAGFK